MSHFKHIMFNSQNLSSRGYHKDNLEIIMRPLLVILREAVSS